MLSAYFPFFIGHILITKKKKKQKKTGHSSTELVIYIWYVYMVFEVHAVLVVNQPYLIAPISKLVNSSNPMISLRKQEILLVYPNGSDQSKFHRDTKQMSAEHLILWALSPH